MTSSDDLVERLRRMADMTTTGNSLSDIRLAATELVRLRERVAELEAKIMELDAENAWTRIQKS
jgi:hypothetical protein